MDIRELLNQLRSVSSDRQISQDMDLARQTVKRYREWAQASGLLEGTLPSEEKILKTGLKDRTMRNKLKKT